MLKIRNCFSKQQIKQESAEMWKHLMQTNQYHKSRYYIYLCFNE